MSEPNVAQDEVTAIEIAYQENIKKLFAMLLEGMVEADGNTSEGKQADERFANGLAIARQTRIRALALVSTPATET